MGWNLRVWLVTLVVLPLIGASPRVSADSGSIPACSATLVHHDAYPGPAGMPNDLPWIRARPMSSHIIGFLFFMPPGATGKDALMHADGKGPQGRADKILWYVSRGKTSRTLTIAGKNLSGSETSRQSFPVTGGRSYPSIVDVPAAGCWRLTLRTGGIRWQVTAEVIP
jgi:hypothetical protein